MCEVSPPCTANNQVLGTLQAVATLFIPKPLKAATSLAVSLILPMVREAVLKKRTMPKQVRVRSRPPVMNRRCPRVKTSRIIHTPRTPPPVLVSSLVSMRTPTLSPTLGSKSRLHGKGSTRTAPRRTAPRKTPVGRCPQRKSHQPMRCFATKLSRKHSCWTCVSMFGVITKLSTMLQAGQ